MRNTPCSGTALRTVCSGSVRGGSKVVKGTRRRRRAEHETPPPSGDGGKRAFRLVAPPPRPAPCAWSPFPGRA